MKFLKQEIKNEKGIVLIWFYLLVVLLLASTASIYALSFQESQLLHMDQARHKAFYLAEAGIDRKLQELRSTGNTGNIRPTDFGNGNYSVEYDASEGLITSTGTFSVGDGQITKTIVVQVDIPIPPGVRGSITSSDNVSINGNITVDGRDYAYNETTGAWEVVGDGTYGISSNGTVNQGGNSEIGGNGTAPQRNATINEYEENSTATIYTTPEEALGLSPGSLDEYKTTSPPPEGYEGIWYMTEDWIGANLSNDENNPNTGILIVHNASGATLKNLHGYFRGIIIADNLIHINGDAEIIGGVVVQNTSDNAIGNGRATVKYSSSVLSNLPDPSGGGNNNQYEIISWQDCQNTEFDYPTSDVCPPS